MSYTINRATGLSPIVVYDNQLDTSTSLTYVGRTYNNYGQIIDQNFLSLLENFANGTAPTKAVAGQLWYDTSKQQLQVNTGGLWKSVTSAYTSNTAPISPATGDFWLDSTNPTVPLLKVWTGNFWFTVGSSGSSGALVEILKDNFGQDHTVISLTILGTRYAILSKDQEFIPLNIINGFPKILPGINLISQSYVPYNRFQGQAQDSQKLGGLYSNAYMRTDINTGTLGSLSVQNNVGINLGASGQAKFNIFNDNLQLINTVNNAKIAFVTKKSNTVYTPFELQGADGVFHNNLTVEGTLITNNLDILTLRVRGPVDSTNSSNGAAIIDYGLAVGHDINVGRKLYVANGAAVMGGNINGAINFYDRNNFQVANIAVGLGDSNIKNLGIYNTHVNGEINIGTTGAYKLNLDSHGNVTVTGSVTMQKQSYMGNITNVKIQGGADGQYVVTDGSGNLRFDNPLANFQGYDYLFPLGDWNGPDFDYQTLGPVELDNNHYDMQATPPYRIYTVDLGSF